MATISPPTLTITNSPAQDESLVTVRYQISFDAFDHAADQPYLETVLLFGDDTGVGDPISAGGDDPLTVLSSAVVRASMNTGTRPFVVRRHERAMPRTALNEDLTPIPNPDEIRALVTLQPQLPVAIAQESNLVSLSITEETENDTTVPDVTGIPGNLAHPAIRAAGLVPRGGPASRLFEVVTQVPDGGTVVERGTTVQLRMERIEPL